MVRDGQRETSTRSPNTLASKTKRCASSRNEERRSEREIGRDPSKQMFERLELSFHHHQQHTTITTTTRHTATLHYSVSSTVIWLFVCVCGSTAHERHVPLNSPIMTSDLSLFLFSHIAFTFSSTEKRILA